MSAFHLTDPTLKQYVLDQFLNVCTVGTFYKCAASLVYVLYAYSFDVLKTEAILALTMLVFLDLVTGVLAAKTCNEEIKSRKIFHSALKWGIYLIMISGAHMVEVAVPQLDGLIDEVMLAFLVLTELISILENIGRMGYSVPQKLLNKLIELKNDK